jgi:hypothetical protein
VTTEDVRTPGNGKDGERIRARETVNSGLGGNVEVTVTLRFPISVVLEAYRHALTPDGGLAEAVTFNAYLWQYAESVAADMSGALTTATSTHEWRLNDA